MKCINEKCLFFNVVNDANCSAGDDVEYAEECIRGNYCYFEPADLPKAEAKRSTYAQLSDVRGNNDIVCPFCEESGFDLIGLKSHISNGDCDPYNQTENISRI